MELTEEEKAEKEAEKRRLYILNRCTKLRFIMLDMSEREVLCEGKGANYTRIYNDWLKEDSAQSANIHYPRSREWCHYDFVEFQAHAHLPSEGNGQPQARSDSQVEVASASRLQVGIL